MKTRYVVGFAFWDWDRKRGVPHGVWLVRKGRPAWQAGRLNGIGGHCEEGEDAGAAIEREFREETGTVINAARWHHYAKLTGPDFEVDCFAAVVGEGDAVPKTQTDEEIVFLPIEDLYLSRVEMLENLLWLIHLAIDCHQDGRPAFARVGYL